MLFFDALDESLIDGARPLLAYGETGGRAQWIDYQRPPLQASPGLELVEADPESDGPYSNGRRTPWTRWPSS